jgi:hypothetical protein
MGVFLLGGYEAARVGPRGYANRINPLKGFVLETLTRDVKGGDG